MATSGESPSPRQGQVSDYHDVIQIADALAHELGYAIRRQPTKPLMTLLMELHESSSITELPLTNKGLLLKLQELRNA